MPLEIEPDQIIDYGQTGLSILTVIFIGLLIYFFVRRGLTSLYQNNYISEALSGILEVLLRWAVIALVVLAGLQQVGVHFTSIWAAVSAFVVLIGVGLVAVWSVLSNILCSVLLLVFRPFKIGDQIELTDSIGGTGIRGKVVNLNMLYTFILEDNNDHSSPAVTQIPNNIFFQKPIRRWNGVRTRQLDEIMFRDDAQSVKQNAAL